MCLPLRDYDILDGRYKFWNAPREGTYAATAHEEVRPIRSWKWQTANSKSIADSFKERKKLELYDIAAVPRSMKRTNLPSADKATFRHPKYSQPESN